LFLDRAIVYTPEGSRFEAEPGEQFMTCNARSNARHRLVSASAALWLALSCAAAAAVAGEPKPQTILAPLLSQQLADLPGKEVVMMTVQYLPGGASLPHRHDAHVFVYVLEGQFRTQIAGHDPVTLKAGQVFYESPQDIHQTSANASLTKPARILVFWLKDKDKPLSRPATH
jgi:quercetin dioxygenase-like cupin family protein